MSHVIGQCRPTGKWIEYFEILLLCAFIRQTREYLLTELFASSVSLINDARFTLTYLVLRLMVRLSDYELVLAFVIIRVLKYAEVACVWLLNLVYYAVSVVSFSCLTLVTVDDYRCRSIGRVSILIAATYFDISSLGIQGVFGVCSGR